MHESIPISPKKQKHAGSSDDCREESEAKQPEALWLHKRIVPTMKVTFKR